MGMLLILAKTIAQAFTTPELVTDSEEPLGTTVSIHSISFSTVLIYRYLPILFPHPIHLPAPLFSDLHMMITVLTIVRYNSLS